MIVARLCIVVNLRARKWTDDDRRDEENRARLFECYDDRTAQVSRKCEHLVAIDFIHSQRSAVTTR